MRRDGTLAGPSMLALVADQTGPSLWRVLQPVTALQKAGYPARWDFKDARGIGDVAPLFDGILLSRMSWAPQQTRIAEMWFAALERAGKFVVYDADDDIFTAELTRRSIALGWTDGKTYAELEAERLARIWAMTHCDGVCVSTQRLATLVRSYTSRPVVVVPNAIDLPWFRRVVRQASRQTPGLTIGWAGGKRPDADVESMAIAWGRLAARYRHVAFVVQGHVPAIVREQVPPERLVVLPWMKLERYPAGLAEVDIACCSVADTPFNRCKCVQSTMRITTNRGVLEAGSLTPGMKVWRSGWHKVEAVRSEVACPGVQITTSSGYQLRLTPEHRMMVNGQWTAARSILPGDCMAMEREAIAVRDAVRVNWPADSRMSRAGYPSRRVQTEPFDPKAFLGATDGPKVDISVRWGRFLGAWAGDGSCGQSTVAAIACDGQDQDWIDLLTSDLRAFGLNPTTEAHKTYDGTVLRRRGIRTASAHFLRVLESLGVARRRENGAPIRVPCVPEVIWRSPRDVIAEFIAAYFEADGSCTGTGVGAVSKDEQLLRDMQRLLLLFGITSRLSVRTGHAQNGHSGQYWMLTLRRSEADLFAEEIGFRSARKRARLAEITCKPHSNAWRPIMSGDEVVKVEPCMVTPVDIQVEGETFVLAGFVSHNSAIKAYEAAVAGAAVVATPTVYGSVIEHGVSGYLAETADDWELWLANLVESHATRQIMAKRLLRQVERQYALADNLWRWPAAWATIAEDARARRGRLVTA